MSSVSMYRDEVDRLRKEIAGLELKRADEVGRAAKEQADASRVAGSISRSTSEGTRRSKVRAIEQKGKKAAGHEARAAKLADQIASKHRALTTAQKNLDRALVAKQQKDDRDARKQREADRRHLREMESARRRAQVWTPSEASPSSRSLSEAKSTDRLREFEYDVCLSLAGEDRAYVEMVAQALKDEGVRVFYDLNEPVTLWGKDLAEQLDYIYRTASRYCVMFISEAYAKKPWTVHERRSALARALEEEAEYVLPARFDDTELPGLRPTVAYIDLREHAPMTLVEFILQKLGKTAAGPESRERAEST